MMQKHWNYDGWITQQQQQEQEDVKNKWFSELFYAIFVQNFAEQEK